MSKGMNETATPLPRGETLLEGLDVVRVPKVLLHEHLDGGLRPTSVIELAREMDYEALPTDDPGELAAWLHCGSQRGNLVEYLEGFQHTIAVMQSRDGIERVAYEFIEDMATDGVVYAEVRFAPVYHTAGGLTQDEVVAAVTDGLRRGGDAGGVRWGLIVCAMRDREDSLEQWWWEWSTAAKDLFTGNE
jgi:adenosine deaminase